MKQVDPTDTPRGGVGADAPVEFPRPTVDLTRLDAGTIDDPHSLAGALFESISQPIALLDCRDGDVVYVAANPAYLWTVGISAEGLLGRAAGDVFPSALAGPATERLLEVAATGHPRSDHDVVLTPRGRRSMESTLIPLSGARVLAVMRDRTDIEEAVAALASSEQRFATLADASPMGIFAVDREGRCTYTNERLQEICGRDAEDLLGFGWFHAIHPDDRETFERGRQLPAAPLETPTQLHMRLRHPGGHIRWIEVRVAPLENAMRDTVGHVGTVDDVTEAIRARRVVDELAAVLENTPDLVAICDPDGRFTWMNAAARTFHGLRPDDEASRLTVFDLFPESSRRKFIREILPTLARQDRWSGELKIASLDDGRELDVHQSIVTHRDPRGAISSYSSIVRDITERKTFEDKLSHQGLHDPLTGLPNRPLFMDRVGQGLARAARLGTNIAVLALDLDRFKVVNDSLGHDAGDALLTAVAHRLRSVIRPTDSIARLGGDEFVILCEDVPGDGIDIAEGIEGAMAAPFVLEEGEIFLTASIGIASTDVPRSADAERMLRDADTAMYRAKEKGRARYEIVDEDLRERATARTETETALRRGLEQEDLVVHYQPVISLAGGDIVGVEALARWWHPDRGLLLPEDFITLAEEAGLIVSLGDRVLRLACAQVAAWRRAGWSPALWVNLSARQLNHLGLVNTLERTIAETGLDAEGLGLEITESVLMDDADSTVAALEKLKRLGVSVAIDDFGTGYSSLAYLKRFPVTTLKIDQTFVDGLGREPEDTAIVNAQISMAHALGISVIAEGVETELQLEHLRALGCDAAQGYLFAPPLPPRALEEMLELDPRW